MELTKIYYSTLTSSTHTAAMDLIYIFCFAQTANTISNSAVTVGKHDLCYTIHELTKVSLAI